MSNPLDKWDSACKLRHSTGGLWKRKQLAKKAGRQTPGREKKGTCVMQMKNQRYLAKGARSYKHKDYTAFCRYADMVNKTT